jgi:hypothetical protein
MQMLEHNSVHLGEYKKWASFANDSQMGDVSNQLNEAQKQVESAQSALQKALDLII